jgi:hypothetical protein
MVEYYEPKIAPKQDLEPQKPDRFRRFLIWVALPVLSTALILFMALKYDEIVVEKDGNAVLSEKRLKQLDKQLKQLDEAEQYVLLATEAGWYICLNCASGKIFLHAGEVWKYGVTIKRQGGRYTSEYLYHNNLEYLVEFRGTIHACLIQEKVKIFYYPMLPENMNRPTGQRLAHPPGNKSAR